MSEKRLFLLDAYALIFRGYYAFIKNPRINSKGLNTSAILGFSNSLFEVIKKEKPTHLAVVFDVGKATVRTDYFPEYKANRDETPEAIKLAVPYIHEILNALKIPILFAEGYEADDVIGTLAVKAEKEGFTTLMMTPDKDFAQLVTENIKVYKPASRGGGIEIWDIEKVKEKFGVNHPEQVIDFLGMMGDSVDNIPGLPGVGEKTAQKFIQKYGSMEALLENTHELKGKQKEKIEANKELGILSKKLATILTDAPVDFESEKLLVEEPDFDKVKEIFDELEFRRLLTNVLKTYGKDTSGGDVSGTPEPAVQPKAISDSVIQASLFGDTNTSEKETEAQPNPKNSENLYQLVDSTKGLELLLDKLLKQKVVCFDTETTSLDALNAELVGISFSYQKGKGYYVPFSENQSEVLSKLNKLGPFFESEEILKVGHNLKYDYKVLSNYGIEVKGKAFDTMIAHYLINPDMRHDMNSLAKVYLNHEAISIETLIGKKGKNQKSFREVPLDKQTEYAIEDADVTLQLYGTFSKELENADLKNIFDSIEMPLMQVLYSMEKEGIALSSSYLNDYSTELEEKVKVLEKEIFEQSEEEFNINSPKQLGVVLFEKLKLVDKPKKTKTGQYATSEEILSGLSHEHKIVSEILRYRQLQKLKSTYVDALPNEVSKKTERVHTTFAQTVAATGRLASNNPNIQNIPIRTPEGQKVREAFVPKDKNHVLLAADYSQIELRLIAEMSKDKVMMDSFLNGEDIHAATAAKIFDVEIDKISRAQRSQAKTVNFGIIYGVSAFGLSRQTGLSRKESKILIDAYYETYPTLKQFMDKQVEFARQNSYVETLLGRRRYLKDIHSNNGTVRSHAERNAVNAPIQGSAADIIKLAMIDIHEKLKAYQSKMLLQVHDELVFDIHKTELEELQPMIKSTMENAFKTEVPLIVECGVGENWLQAH